MFEKKQKALKKAILLSSDGPEIIWMIEVAYPALRSCCSAPVHSSGQFLPVLCVRHLPRSTQGDTPANLTRVLTERVLDVLTSALKQERRFEDQHILERANRYWSSVDQHLVTLHAGEDGFYTVSLKRWLVSATDITGSWAGESGNSMFSWRAIT